MRFVAGIHEYYHQEFFRGMLGVTPCTFLWFPRTAAVVKLISDMKEGTSDRFQGIQMYCLKNGIRRHLNSQNQHSFSKNHHFQSLVGI